MDITTKTNYKPAAGANQKSPIADASIETPVGSLASPLKPAGGHNFSFSNLLSDNSGVTRAEFLSFLGLLSVSVIGTTALVKKLAQDKLRPGLTGPTGPTGQQGLPGKNAKSKAGEPGATGATGPAGSAGTGGGSSSSDSDLAQEFETHQNATTNVHGIDNTDDLMLLSVAQIISALKTFEQDGAADTALATRVDGDTEPRLAIQAGGELAWGSGGAAADTNLYRSSANTLTTDDSLVVGGTLVASNYKRGTGTPEGNVTGSVGDLFLRTDGAGGTTLYIKESGNSTNTGWVAVAAGGGATELDDLTDVTLAGLADEEFLVYDSGTSQWRNRTITDTDIPAGIARDSEVATAVSDHNSDTTSVHGIADTSALMLEGDAAGGVLSGTYPNPGFAADMATQAELDAHTGDTTDAHDASAISFSPAGSIAATDTQAAIEEVASDTSTALSTHEADTTNVHGIADTSVLATDSEVATAVSDHSADTTSVHGIADTSTLLTSLNVAVRSESSAYPATASDAVILCDATSGAFTVTLPTAVGNTGKVFYIKKTDASANAVTIDGNGGQTIDAAATAAITVQYASVTIVSDNANWHII